MIINKYFFIVQLLLFSFCLCDISEVQKEKLLNGFIDYYNNLPNQVYQCDEGSLQSTQQVDETTYQIVAKIRVTEIYNIEVTKLLKCTATVQDSDNDVTVTNNSCQEAEQQSSADTGTQEKATEAQVEVTEPTVERKPVQLDNEVQSDTTRKSLLNFTECVNIGARDCTFAFWDSKNEVSRDLWGRNPEKQHYYAITSGEQFIAIPRNQPSAPCIGCSLHVNPQAAGVDDLANLGVRHLDIHEPSVKHSLDSVIDVERQVQVVNGVRYILTLSIHSNSCTEVQSESCASSKICKITILVKPWVKLPHGGNYRAILANNCTEAWLYGDNGEVLPELSTDNRDHDQVKGNTSVDPDDDIIQVKHNTNVQSLPNQGRSLTGEELKKLQDQIIPNAQFQETTEPYRSSAMASPDASDVSKQHTFKVESSKHSENSIPVTESEKTEQQTLNINLDKKKAIDDMLDFFDFSGFKPKSVAEDVIPRVRRSYDYDLQVLSLAEDFHGIKNSIKNARFMYEMAQAMVDYLNEVDMEVKNRAVKNVVRAEEETENMQRFIYIQARVTIPCDKVECEPTDVVNQICNGVIDSTNENSPQILNTFCYNDNKERDYRDVVKEISVDDPVLQKLAEEAVKKIESESNSQYALRINKIASAITQVTSGTLTKFSVVVENIKCNKSVPLALRINCTVLEHLGSKICEVIIHERHWLKERKISYTCTDRPVDMRISKSKSVVKNVTVDDPEIIEMLQEAIQYLETQSDKNNKQKIVNVKSISTQIIAGFLTKIEFVVAYTNCTDENYSRDEFNKCEFLKDEGLRSCKAQIWDRSWIMDGRQVEVSCDDAAKNNEIDKSRKKRSIDFTKGQAQQSVSKVNDLEYKKLAIESLYKFMRTSSSRQHYEVIKVDRVMVQDVSGKLIRIIFSISPTNCLIQNDGLLSSTKCDIVNPKNILHCRSKILKNVWIDKKQYFVNCNIKYNYQQKNSQELKQRNPNDAKYYQLAEESLIKYLHDTGNPHHKVVRVEKVTTQIVSGLLTRIDFIVSPKNQSDNDNVTISCHSDILEKHWLGTKNFNVSCQMKQKKKINDTVEEYLQNPKYMQIAVESLQKYIKNNPESNLVRVTFIDKVVQTGEIINITFVASHTEDDDGDTLCYAEFSESGPKNDLEVKCHLIGTVLKKTEITEEDPNYYKYAQLADESLRNYLQNISQFYTIASIESVTMQWDEGIKTLINFIISPIDLENSELQVKQCLAEIREQPWLHKKNIDVKCELEKDLFRTKRWLSHARVRRQVLGGSHDQDPTKPRYQALAEESLRKYVADSGITQPLKVARVEKVSTKVVSGTLTCIDFLVSGSQDSKTIKCHSEVWEQPWLNNKQINVSCQNDDKRGKKELLGGLHDEDPTKPRYKVLAEESLRKYVADSGITQPLKLARVDKVTTQVVAGLVTRIDFLVSDSQDSKAIKCHSEVLEQSWLNNKEITVVCSPINERVKRDSGMPGGITERDPTEPKFKVLAEESLQKYILESGTTQSLQVVRVEKASTQVVAGLLIRIDFLVSGSQDAKTIKCHSEVWDRPWLNKKEITVDCSTINERVKRDLGMTGGITERDPTEPKFRVLAEESLQKYILESGTTQSLQVVRVEKASTQVVSGIATRIDFLVSGSQDSKTIKCHSEVLEQSWLNNKQITVVCSPINERIKRDSGMPGGITERDPTEPKFRVLAEESLQKYILESGTTQSLQVVRVEKASTQVVAGSLIRIDFLVSGSQDAKTIKCHSEVWDRPWLNKKEITVDCSTINERVKRDLGMTGGITERDPTEPKFKVLAEESLQKYILESGTTQSLQVVRVEKASTQVVAGSLIRIDFLVSGSQDAKTIKCHSEVWDRPWLNKKEITVDCSTINERVKRDLGMTGGITERDPTEPKFKVLAEESLQKYILESGTTQSLQVVRVEKASTQVVAGSLIRIDFLVSGSQDAKTIKCHSEVWDRPWLNKKEITVDCSTINERVKRDLGMTGGITERDPTEPKFKVLAEESLQKYILESGTTQSLQVVRVEKASTQVVAGSLIRIDFLVSGSQDAKTIKCHSEVWDRPWLNKKEITVDCSTINERVKRDLGMTGGITERDPTEPKFKVLAEESLQKYILESGTTQSLQVVRVEKASTQVVAGSLIRIDFLVSGSQDAKTIKCHSEVWDRPWLNKKEITVDCSTINERVKRDLGMTGGITERDPTEPKFKVLAEESLQKYILESGTTQSLQVVRVEKASTQVVAGSLIRIDFLVSGSQDAKTIKCHSEVWDRPWLNKKEITVDCSTINEKVKRDLGMTGGITERDPTESKFKVLAEESLQKYILESGTTQSLQVVRVEKASTQVVAGSLIRIDFLVSGSQDAKTIKCHSEVWDRPWLNKKEITVDCSTINKITKRDLRLSDGASEQNLRTPRHVLAKESIRGNSSKKVQEHVSVLRGHIEEEQDPNKPEYKLLVEESLRKYEQKHTVYHKVLEVKRVSTRVVSGLKYKIDFSAVPTVCSANVSSVRARSCKTDDDVILYCHTEIWDRPWLKQKKIDVQCNNPTDDNDDFKEYDNDFSFEPSVLKKNNDEKYIKLAEEASEKYLTTSNRKYVHKVTEIHSVSEQIADGKLGKLSTVNICYSLSPTTCLRNEATNNTSCKLKQPLIVFNCTAKIQSRSWLHIEKGIKVTCKKIGEQKSKKHKRELGVRNTRQIGDEDDEIDEDTTYYYADRAIQHMNDQSDSNNLHKLISIHDVQNSIQMHTLTVKMYIEVAETFCLRHQKADDLRDCEEMNGLNHRLCLARLWPSPDDELVVRHVSVVCDDDEDFELITGVNIPELLRMSIVDLERSPEAKFKLVHQGEPQVIPSLDSKRPFKINFVVATTNCSKDVNLDKNPFQCYLNPGIPSKACHSFIWLKTETKFIRYINAKCTPLNRVKRSALEPANVNLNNSEIQYMVTAALEKLEMQSLHRYKQRVLQINSHSTKITSGKVTTIDFDVGYTSCLKYEWVENITSCNFLEHLPRRRCVAQIWERLWINNGKNIDLNCVDDETPLESHIEFESAEMANSLAREALKHIEAKYPHPSKQKVVRIFSLEKQVVAGIHYKMKVEVGFTDCVALSDQKDCKLLKNHGLNKFCRVNVWVRPWTDHPPNFRVSCDFQEGTTHDLYHHVQAEHLFYNFLTTYSPSYVNSYSQMQKRFEIFKKNIKKIHEFNVHEKGTAVYGVTRFTDLTYEEFSSTYMGLKTNLSNENQVPMKKADIPDIKVPPNFDWREYDAVTEVKDQGSCGSCWAFSVTGNIEGQWKMQSGQLLSLSEQELVDCDKLDDGCNGGLPDNAYRAIEQMGGLELESDYPYEGVDEKCEFNKTKAKVQISGAVNITSNETGMAQWLVHNGPISIGINANAMQFYMGGISHPWKMLCNPTNLDHGVLIVGYGIKDYPLFHKRLPYWIIKNSWGKSWGEQGYYRVYRGDGTCGLNQMASSAVI